MTDKKKDFYIEMVSAWEKKKAKGLSSGEKALLFEKALKVVIGRALQTLSGVTLMVVLDRVLHQSKGKYPVLLKVKVKKMSLILVTFRTTTKEMNLEILNRPFAIFL